jgi:uncharacterized protein
MNEIAILSGFAIGAIVGMTGVGGGSLMTPLLIGVFKLPPGVAIGTDLWFAALTKAGGAIAHARHGQVDWRITGVLLAGSLPASVATSVALHGLKLDWSGVLSIWLGVGLLLTALVVAFRGHWQALGEALQTLINDRLRLPLTVVAGVLLGVLVTLSSIGAGALGAALLTLLHPKLSAHRLVGTDIAHAVPLTLAAGIGHATLGHVDWGLLGALLIGSLPGIWLGAQLTRAMPEKLMRALLASSLVAAGLKVM